MLRSENEIVFPFEKFNIFTVVPFVHYMYLSHLGRGLYHVVYSLCPIPLSFCNKICLIQTNNAGNTVNLVSGIIRLPSGWDFSVCIRDR